MNHADIAVCISIVVKLAALGILVRLRHELPRWVYWNLSLMLGVLIARMTLLLVNYFKAVEYTSLIVSLQIIITALFFQRIVYNSRKKVAELAEENKSLGHRLAEHLADTRAQIQFYEDQAARNGLEFYKKAADK